MSAVDSEEMESGADDSDHIHTRSADKSEKKRKGPSAGALLGLVRSNMFKNAKNVKGCKKDKGMEEKKQHGRGRKSLSIGNSPVVAVRPEEAKDEESTGGSQSVQTATPVPHSSVKSFISRGPRFSASGLSSPASSISSADVEIPFKLGWRRELVHRTPGESRPVIDIYYFSPDGRKFRSHPQIVEHLEKTGSTLSATSFSFSKCKLYHEPMESERYASLTKGHRLINGQIDPTPRMTKKRKMAADEDGRVSSVGAKKQKLEDGSKKITKPKSIDFVKSDLEELHRELNRMSPEPEQIAKPEPVVTKVESKVTKPMVMKPTVTESTVTESTITRSTVMKPTAVITEEMTGRTRRSSTRRMSDASQEVTSVKSPRAGMRMKRETSNEGLKPVVIAQEKILEMEPKISTTFVKGSEVIKPALSDKKRKQSGVVKLTVGTDQGEIPEGVKKKGEEKNATVNTNEINSVETRQAAVNAQPAQVDAVNAQVIAVSSQPAQVNVVSAAVQAPASVVQSSAAAVQAPAGVVQSPAGVVQFPAGAVQAPVVDKREMVRAAASQTLKLFMSRALRGTTTPVSTAAASGPSDVSVAANATTAAALLVPSIPAVAAIATAITATPAPSAPPVAGIATVTAAVDAISTPKSTAVEATSEEVVTIPSAGSSAADQPKPAKRLKKGWVMEVVFVPDVKVESDEVKVASLERETRHRRASKYFTPDGETKTPTSTKRSQAKSTIVKSLPKPSGVIGDSEKYPVAANEEISTATVARKPKIFKSAASSSSIKSSMADVLNTTLESETSEFTNSMGISSPSKTECSEDVKFNDSLSNIISEDVKLSDSLTSIASTPTSGKVVKRTGKSLKGLNTSQQSSETGISPKVRVMKTVKKAVGKNASSVASSSASSLVDSSPAGAEKDGERAKVAKIVNKKTGSVTVVPPTSGKSLLKDATSSAVNVTQFVKISQKGSAKELPSLVGSKSVMMVGGGAEGSPQDKTFISMQDCGMNVIQHPVGLMSRAKPCGLDCPGRLSIPPSLYCQVCMVAFHPECVGFKYLTCKGNFTCWDCKLASRESVQRSYSLNSYVPPVAEKSPQPSPVKTPAIVSKKKPTDETALKPALKPASATAVLIKSGEKLPAKDKSKTKDKSVTLKSAAASATDTVKTGVKSKSSTAAASVKIELNKKVSVAKLPKKGASADALKESKTPQQIENESNGKATNKTLAIPELGEITEKKKNKKKRKKVVPCPSELLKSGEVILLPSGLLGQIDKTLPCDICLGNKAIRVCPKKFQQTPAGYRVVLPSGSLPESYLLGHRVPLQFTVGTTVKDGETFTNITVTVFGERSAIN